MSTFCFQYPKCNLHTHTRFCDGKDTPEEIVLAAMEQGLEVIGFSGHSRVHFDPDCSMSLEGSEQYRKEILRLRRKYGEKIDILLGIEQDFYADEPPSGYDYVIGSVHYLPCPDGYFALDQDPQTLKNAVDRYYGGRMELLWKHYFETVGQLARRTRCDIVGHIDLLSKFNEDGRLFDEASPFYLMYAQQAIDRLLQSDVLFEINTGAISRGYRKTPYPSQRLLNYIVSNGGELIVGSDAHAKQNLTYWFDKAAMYASASGAGSLVYLTREGRKRLPL